MFTAIAVVVSFIVGVVAHKYVVSEATSIKAHVSGEVGRLRNEIIVAAKAAESKV